MFNKIFRNKKSDEKVVGVKQIEQFANEENESVALEKIIKDLNDEFIHDAKTIKYRIRDNRHLDILMICQKDKKSFFRSFMISKDRDSIIGNNSLISLKNTFFVGPLYDKVSINNYDNNSYLSTSIVDNTEYNKICLQCGTISTVLINYSFENKFFIENYKKLEQNYNKVINLFNKIFNDVANNYDFEEVRATPEEELIIDELLKTKDNLQRLKNIQ